MMRTILKILLTPPLIALGSAAVCAVLWVGCRLVALAWTWLVDAPFGVIYSLLQMPDGDGRWFVAGTLTILLLATVGVLIAPSWHAASGSVDAVSRKVAEVKARRGNAEVSPSKEPE